MIYAIVAALLVVVVIVVVAVVVSRKRSAPQPERLPAEEERPPAAEPETAARTSAPAEAAPEAARPAPEIDEAAKAPAAAPPEGAPAPEPAAVAAPEKAPAEEVVVAPGVRLDDDAERAAAEQLLEAKRERKLKKLRQGLAQTRGGFIAKLGALFREKKEIDPALLGQIEEALITADVGAKTTEWLVALLREALDKKELADPEAVWGFLKREVKRVLSVEAKPVDANANKPHSIMIVGVNGVGKTTTIGKLAAKFSEQGSRIVLAAADTFRAAAVNQLEIWGRRTKCEVVKSKEGADPSSVVFDAIKRAKEIGADIVIADTAGRLHTQVTLMEELKKVARVMGKAHEGAPQEVLLVLDATTGQNALLQVREFGDSLGLTGLILTKLDGTAKGGVIIGICHEHKIPVRYIGIGEAKDDLRDFDVDEFVDALFLKDGEDGAGA